MSGPVWCYFALDPVGPGQVVHAFEISVAKGHYQSLDHWRDSWVSNFKTRRFYVACDQAVVLVITNPVAVVTCLGCIATLVRLGAELIDPNRRYW